MTTISNPDHPIRQDEHLADKEIFEGETVIGLRRVSGDGIWFIPYSEKHAALSNRHFDSFEAFWEAFDAVVHR